MLSAQFKVRQMMEAYGQDCPKEPIIPSDAVCESRARLTLEEALEKVNKGYGLQVMIGSNPVSMSEIKFVRTQPVNMVELVDGIADLEVVNIGDAVAVGIILEPFFDEVMRSNASKTIDGYLDTKGKYRKGPSYSPANISACLKEQGWNP